MVDPATLARLWESHSGRLLLVARAIGEPAEDAVQEAFMKLAVEAELPQDPLAWLVRVTRNQLLQWHRSRKRRHRRERSVGAERNWFDGEAERVERRLDGAVVSCWLRELPAAEREVIVMHLWGEMTFRQIAEATGGSHAAAHRLYAAGLQMLKEKQATKPSGVMS